LNRTNGLELQLQRIRLDGYIVDFQKQTVSRNGHVVQLQSKILQVLACLIAAQGQLVTIEQLMSQVWGNTIVSPNTLQRCIAQLRKAFDDNSQTQRLIKTYPRRGYELVLKPEPCAAVDASQHIAMQHSIDQSRQPDLVCAAAQTRSIRTGLSYRSYLTPLALLLFAGVAGAWYQTAQTAKSLEHSKAPLQLNVHSRLTATDAHEQLPTYSADGNWIAFSRFESFCHGEIWLQQVSTKTEWQLSKQPQRFEALAFAPDSQRLATLSVADCQVPQQPLCWQVQLYQFVELAKVQQQPVGDCEQHELSQLQWQDQQHLLMLRRSALTGLRSLVRFELATGQTEAVFSAADVLSFQSLPSGDIALLVHQGSAETALVRLNPQGKQLQVIALRYRQRSAFNPPTLLYLASRDQLLLAAAGLLFQIQADGELSPHPLPAGIRLTQIQTHPSQTRVVASAGGSDLDLLLWQRKQQRLESIFRSHAFESQARIAPVHGNGAVQIAFVSDRSGQNEIWLAEAEQLRQLSRFSGQVQINGMVWQADGHALLLNINDQLFKLSLDGQLDKIAVPVRLKYLHQLTSQGHLLIEYQHEFSEMLALFELRNHELQPLRAGHFDDARLDDEGSLWFTNAQFRLFRQKFALTASEQAEPVLADLEISAFMLYAGQLLLSSKDGQLLQFEQQSLRPSQVAVPLPAGSWLNDADQHRVLLGNKISIKTELVELQSN
jgi:DNA-binding winged helix-turn-helix (wHTH) protein